MVVVLQAFLDNGCCTRSSKVTPNLPRHTGRHRVTRLGSPTRRVLSTVVLFRTVMFGMYNTIILQLSGHAARSDAQRANLAVLISIFFYDLL